MNKSLLEPLQISISTIIVVTTAALLYQPRLLVQRAGHDAWLAVLLGTVLGALFGWVLWATYFRQERAPGEPPGGGQPSLGGRLLALGFAAYALYIGVLLVAQVATVFTTVLPEMPIAVFAAGTALTGWFLAAYGREALHRTGQLLFPLMVLASVVNLAVSVAGNVDVRELLPVLEMGPLPVFKTVFLVFAFGSEALVLTAAAGAVRAPHQLAVYLPVSIVLSGLLMAAYTAGVVGVLGSHEAARSTFPVLALARQVRIGLFLQRMEILTLFAWLMGTFVKKGLLINAASESLSRALSLKPRWHGTVAAAAATATGLLGVTAFANSFALIDHTARVFPVIAWSAAVLFLVAGLWGTRRKRPAPSHRWPRVRKGNGRGRALAVGVLLLAVMLLVSGCYGRVEPEQAAVATVLGLDRSAQGGVRLTLEVVGAQAGAPVNQGAGIAHQLVRSEGRSLLEAQQRLELQVAREVLWSHINVVVVGRDLAAGGLRPVLDGLTRRYSFRRHAFLFVADGDAGRLLEDLVPSFGAPRFVAFQRAILRPSGRTSLPTDLNAVLRVLGHSGEDPYVPVVAKSTTSGEPVFREVALFRGDRLVTVLDESATRGLYWLTGQQQVERVLWPCPGQPSVRGLGVTAVRSQANRRSGLGKNGPWANAALRIEADVEEWQCQRPLTPATLAEAERAGEAAVASEVRAALAAVRALAVDPAGFGAELRRTNPAAWSAIHRDWRRQLDHLPVHVQVDVKLRRTGLTMEPPG